MPARNDPSQRHGLLQSLAVAALSWAFSGEARSHATPSEREGASSTPDVSGDVLFEQYISQMRYHDEKIAFAYGLFIRSFSLIVAGAIWLSIQPRLSADRNAYVALSDALAVLLCIQCSIMVWAHSEAYFKYKSALPTAPLQRGAMRPVESYGPPLGLVEYGMIISMAAVTLLFVAANPFGALHWAELLNGFHAPTE